MKVLQIINSSARATGGAEKLALQFHQTFLRQVIDSHLLSLEAVPSAEVPYTYSLNLRSPYQLQAVTRLYAFLSQRQWRDVDIIHVHLFPAQIYVPLVAGLLGLRARLVTTEHNTFNRRRRLPLGQRFDRCLYHFYARIACISSGTHETMTQWLPTVSSKLVTIPNGIDFSAFDVVNRQAPSPAGPLIILSAGRLTEQKNYETALRAIALLQTEDFEYWIAGQGEREASLKVLVQTLGLQAKVKFLGFRHDLPQLLAKADIFLLTSRWEGFGLAVVEAMAAGLPVVVSDVAGVREVVDPAAKAGFLVDPTDPESVAQRVDELLQAAGLRKEMGEASRRQAARFDIVQTVDQYLKLYHNVLEHQPVLA